jgi:hypothetical protein
MSTAVPNVLAVLGYAPSRSARAAAAWSVSVLCFRPVQICQNPLATASLPWAPSATHPAFVAMVGSGARQSAAAPTISSEPPMNFKPHQKRLAVVSWDWIDWSLRMAAS